VDSNARAPEALPVHLSPTEFLDFRSPEVEGFARLKTQGAATPREQAVRLFYAIRDGILYDVYAADLSRAGLRASAVLRNRSGFCIHKSILYAAAARCLGIPARLGFADVRNHLSTPRLTALVGGDVFRYHAYAEVWLDGAWRKVTPVFNRVLCHLFGVAPLEFDGTNDAMLQPFDKAGQRYLEVLVAHGTFDDFPYERCIGTLRVHHPRLFARDGRTVDGDLAHEAQRTS
jgi:transglutaminase-like putative cysteine protease